MQNARGATGAQTRLEICGPLNWLARVCALALALGSSACVSGLQNDPINAAIQPASAAAFTPPASPDENFEDTAVAMSFSGGGTRAAAFAYGVLNEMANTPVASDGRRSNLAEQVDFISTVSGGSIIGAYFALKGQAGFKDFKEKFLLEDVEASLRTSINLPNLMLIGKGGLNDRSGLQAWLDQNLFRNATYGDLYKRGRPVLWVNASDIYNRTTFVFNRNTFGALCSDLSKLPVSEAVAASAAVPLIFVPTNISNFADRCQYTPPDWVASSLTSSDAPAILRANAEAISRYRQKKEVQFVKLLDGGLTDNLGLSGMLIERLGAKMAYEPFGPREAVRMKRLLFLVVDAGRPPGGDWAKGVENPKASDLVLAVTDTAVDANVRSSYDAFTATMADWQRDLIAYRCALPPAKVLELRGSLVGWSCRDLTFDVTRISFDEMPDPKIRAELNAIPTRFKLPKKNIDLLLTSASTILRRNPSYQRFLKSFNN